MLLGSVLGLRTASTGAPVPLPPGWFTHDRALHATLEVLDLDESGAIVMPPNITHVVLEVGSNSRNWQWNEPLPVDAPGIVPGVPLRDQENVLLIAFEPMLDHYARYLSMFTHADSLWPWPPGWSARGRAIVLPFAVGADPADGPGSGSRVAQLHVADVDGCSSLLSIDGNQTSGGWKGTFLMRHCGRQGRRRPRRVPVVSLATIIGTWLRGRAVSFVKCDAQGYDLQVAESAGAFASQIHAMQLEVTADTCRTAYVGAKTCSATVAGMRALGFVEKQGSMCQDIRWRNHGCAADMVFVRETGRIS